MDKTPSTDYQQGDIVTIPHQNGRALGVVIRVFERPVISYAPDFGLMTLHVEVVSVDGWGHWLPIYRKLVQPEGFTTSKAAKCLEYLEEARRKVYEESDSFTAILETIDVVRNLIESERIQK